MNLGHLHQLIYSPALPRQMIQMEFTLINTLQLMAELNFLLQVLPGNVVHIVGQSRIKAHLILLIIVQQGV